MQYHDWVWDANKTGNKIAVVVGWTNGRPKNLQLNHKDLKGSINILEYLYPK